MSGTRRKAGRLGPQVEGYRAWLAEQGYTPQTVRNMLKDLGQVGLWMLHDGLVTAQLDEDAMVAFLATRHRAGHRRVSGTRAMVPLLSYLRDVGVTPVAKPVLTPLGALLGEYRTWLVQERGLAATTVLRYENTARRFLQQQAMADGVLETAGLMGSMSTRSCFGSAVVSLLGRRRDASPNCARSCVSCICRASRRCGWGRRCLRSADGGWPPFRPR